MRLEGTSFQNYRSACFGIADHADRVHYGSAAVV